MRFFKIILLLQILFIVLFTGCKSTGQDEPVVPEANFTVLVYMVAANDLGQDVTLMGTLYPRADGLDMDEMESAAAKVTDGSRWLVFHSSYESVELLELTKNGFKTLKTYTDGCATQAERMAQVIDDVATLAPSDRMGLVLWSHASGWIEDGFEDVLESTDNSAALLSFGRDRGRKMNITSLRAVLEQRPMHYIYFDCCLMGSVEVAYELRNCADYIISSPSELPREGMPYHLNVAPLSQGTYDGIVAAAKNTFNHYDSKLEDERTATMVVVETAGMERLAGSVHAIYSLTEPKHPLSVVTNYYGHDRVAQGYYLDLDEYVEALGEAHAVDPALLDEYRAAFKSTVKYAYATPYLWNNWPMHHAAGLSTRVYNADEFSSTGGYNRLEWYDDVVKDRFNKN